MTFHLAQVVRARVRGALDDAARRYFVASEHERAVPRGRRGRLRSPHERGRRVPDRGKLAVGVMRTGRARRLDGDVLDAGTGTREDSRERRGELVEGAPCGRHVREQRPAGRIRTRERVRIQTGERLPVTPGQRTDCGYGIVDGEVVLVDPALRTGAHPDVGVTTR